MKKILFLALAGLAIYLAYAKIIKPLVEADKGKTSNLFFGNITLPTK